MALLRRTHKLRAAHVREVAEALVFFLGIFRVTGHSSNMYYYQSIENMYCGQNCSLNYRQAQAWYSTKWKGEHVFQGCGFRRLEKHGS